jgi:hypothetical protein
LFVFFFQRKKTSDENFTHQKFSVVIPILLERKMDNDIARWEEVILEQTKPTDEPMIIESERITYGIYHPSLEPKQVKRYGATNLLAFLDLAPEAYQYGGHFTKKKIFFDECERLERGCTFLGVETQEVQESDDIDIPHVHLTVNYEKKSLVHFYRCGPNIHYGPEIRPTESGFILCKHPNFTEKYYIVHFKEQIQLPRLVDSDDPRRTSSSTQKVQIVWPFMFCQLKLAIQTNICPDLWLFITHLLYILYCQEASFEYSQCKKNLFAYWTEKDRLMEAKLSLTINEAMKRVGNPRLANFFD